MGQKRRLFFSVWLALILAMGVSTAMAGVVPGLLYDKASGEGSVRVIVQFRLTTLPEGQLESADAVASQRQDIAALRFSVLAELAGTSHRTTRAFETIPFVALEVAPDALSALEASPNVVAVEEDRLAGPSLSESVPLIQAPQAWAAGFDGTGIAVAILDTGVDKTHPFLSGKVFEEACYSSNGNCPNGLTAQTGSGAGVPCNYASGACRHGTHVAGIAAGAGAGAGVSFSGVAKGAQLMAVQVFSRFTGTNCIGGEDPCALSFTSDLIAGLERVFALRNQRTIASVNMSLGGGQFTSSSSCDSANAAQKAAIDNLRSVGIATVIASGNDGFTDGLSAPGCISTAVSVGSTTKADAISSFSNSASFLSLLAPGSSINSSVPGGGFAIFSGTSMATPHVAGAWAILKQKKPTATVDEALTALRSTGLPITDSRNGVITPRIQVFSALQSLGGGGAAAAITSPTPGSTLPGSTATFAWTAGSGALQYWLYIGTSPGGQELYSQSQGLNRSTTLSGFPTDGRTLYVRLWTESGTSGNWLFRDYIYTAASGGGGGAAAAITSPTPGSTLPGSTATFAWTAGSGALQYWLYVGSVQGGTDLYSQSQGLNRSLTLTGLPTDGLAIWVRLWTEIGTSGNWFFNDYMYTAALR